MPAIYSTAVKNTRMQAVVTALGGTATLTIGTDALAGGATGVLAQVPLANPAGTVADGVLTLTQTPRTVVAAATGVAAKAELRAGNGTVIMSGLTVGVVAGPNVDVLINSTAVSAGQTIQVTAGAINHG